MGTEAEVLDSLTGVLGATEEQSVGTGRGAQGKLVQSQGLTTGLLDAGTGGSGETQSSDRQLGDVQETVVVSDGTDDNDGLALLGLGDVGSNARERDGGTVDARHKETAENSLVELGLRTACNTKENRSVFRFFLNILISKQFASTADFDFDFFFFFGRFAFLHSLKGTGISYGQGSGRASQAPASKRSRS